MKTLDEQEGPVPSLDLSSSSQADDGGGVFVKYKAGRRECLKALRNPGSFRIYCGIPRVLNILPGFQSLKMNDLLEASRCVQWFVLHVHTYHIYAMVYK